MKYRYTLEMFDEWFSDWFRQKWMDENPDAHGGEPFMEPWSIERADSCLYCLIGEGIGRWYKSFLEDFTLRVVALGIDPYELAERSAGCMKFEEGRNILLFTQEPTYYLKHVQPLLQEMVRS